MLTLSPAVRIYAATGATDLRRSIDGLSGALTRVARHGAELLARADSPATATAITAYLEILAPQLAERPLPTGIAARFYDLHALIIKESLFTLEATLLGFGLSVVIGVPLGMALVSSRAFNRAVYPLLVWILNVSCPAPGSAKSSTSIR